MKQSVINTVRKDYNAIDGPLLRDVAIPVIKAMLKKKSKSLTNAEFCELVPWESIRNGLLYPQGKGQNASQSVFTYHPVEDIVTFKSRLALLFAEERFQQ